MAGKAPAAVKPAPLGITDVSLRDGHQSLLATRLRTEDLLPVCEALDSAGFWSLECWGGATYDACIRYLGEDPWERLAAFRKAMPNSRLQMLLRGQNLLGYRHYADDVVDAFVEHSAEAGIDVFRVFDALNDPRNMQRALQAVRATGKHAQGTLAYTTSPVHNLQYWLDLARTLVDYGVDSIAIKDMAGLLAPYTAEELVGRLKELVDVPIHMQCHATTGLSTATAVKAVEAGLDNLDTSISSLSMTYGHSPTETVAAIFADGQRATGLDLDKLQQVAAHFRKVRQRYSAFEGSLRGVDARILTAQVPGGMLSNLESQLRQQNAADRLDEVMEEVPRVRQELGYIPLVTPSSQIVGAQAVLNILAGTRYQQITGEAAALLRGEYGATPTEVDADLRARALDGAEPTTGRPADQLADEMDNLRRELAEHSAEEGFETGGGDVFTYALFALTGLNFLRNRGNAEAFEVPPATVEEEAAGHYLVRVADRTWQVQVGAGGDVQMLTQAQSQVQPTAGAASSAAAQGGGDAVPAPLAGQVLAIQVQPGDRVEAGQVLLRLEAMKMETEVPSPRAGEIGSVSVQPGDQVASGDELMRLL